MSSLTQAQRMAWGGAQSRPAAQHGTRAAGYHVYGCITSLSWERSLSTVMLEHHMGIPEGG